MMFGHVSCVNGSIKLYESQPYLTSHVTTCLKFSPLNKLCSRDLIIAKLSPQAKIKINELLNLFIYSRIMNNLYLLANLGTFLRPFFVFGIMSRSA